MDYLKSFDMSELISYLKEFPSTDNFDEVEKLLISKEAKFLKELEFYKTKCSEYDKKLKSNDSESVIEEKAVERINFLVDELQKTRKDKDEEIVKLKLENRCLKCEIKIAEDQIEAQKRRFKELEIRVAKYAKGISDLVCVELKDECGNVSKRSDSDGGMKDESLSCDGNVPDFTSVADSLCHSPVKDGGDDGGGGLIEGSSVVNPSSKGGKKEQTNSSVESDTANTRTVSKEMGLQVRKCSYKNSGSHKSSIDTMSRVLKSSIYGSPKKAVSVTTVKTINSNKKDERIESRNSGDKSSSLLTSKPKQISGALSDEDDVDDIPLSARMRLSGRK